MPIVAKKEKQSTEKLSTLKQICDNTQTAGVIHVRYKPLVNPSKGTEHNLDFNDFRATFFTSMICFNVLTILVEGKRFHPSYSPSYSTNTSHLSLRPIFLPSWCGHICSIS
ncbi:hypothetical protein BT93_D1794 [Corymbia citriodora subsp. variegata]|nr:hypothetical protein BT93_D1794 [Corymbia citriodora subsp. variegata]